MTEDIYQILATAPLTKTVTAVLLMNGIHIIQRSDFMKNSLLMVSAATLLATSHPSMADPSPASPDWDASIGLATITLPSYLGDDRNRTLIGPNLSISYKSRFFASTSGGLGYNLINKDGWRAGPIVKYHAGRQQDGDEGYFIDDENTDDLQGLGDIDGTPELGGFIEFAKGSMKASLEIRQGTDGHEGAIGDASVQYIGNQVLGGRPMFFEIGPKLSVGDSDYLGTFFGVNEQQADASGLSPYEIDGGVLSYGAHGSVVFPMTDHVSLIGFGGMDVLAENIADSPLVATRGSDEQGTAGIVLNVSF